MKTLKQYMTETPSNCSAGTGVRGFGDVSGNPGGTLSNWAAQNASTPPPGKEMVDQHLALHGAPTIETDTLKAGMDADTKDNILHGKGKKK